MSPDERTLITQLFDRLRGAATAQRDPEAEAFIRQQIAQQPYAPYAMAQAIVAQQKALEVAQQRIRQLEAAAQENSPYYGRESDTGFANPSYGNQPYDAQRPMGAPGYGAAQPQQSPWHTDRAPAGAPAPSPWGGQPQQPQPWQQQPMPQQGGGAGGFLAGALQTAAGVAGGALLFEGIRDMFGGGRESASSSSLADNSLLGDPNAVDRFASNQTSTDTSSDNSDSGGGGWFSNLFGGGDDSNADSDAGDLGGDDSDNGDDWA